MKQASQSISPRCAHQLFLGLLSLSLIGCGSVTYDVSRNTLYQSGGYAPGHIYRLKVDAIVIALTDAPYRDFLQHERIWVLAPSPPAEFKRQLFLQRAAMPHPPIFKIVREIPKGSRFRIDSVRHHLANFVITENWVEVRGTILNGRCENSVVMIEGDSDLSLEHRRLFGLTVVPMPNPKYLEDVTSRSTAAYR